MCQNGLFLCGFIILQLVLGSAWLYRGVVRSIMSFFAASLLALLLATVGTFAAVNTFFIETCADARSRGGRTGTKN